MVTNPSRRQCTRRKPAVANAAPAKRIFIPCWTEPKRPPSAFERQERLQQLDQQRREFELQEAKDYQESENAAAKRTPS